MNLSSFMITSDIKTPTDLSTRTCFMLWILMAVKRHASTAIRIKFIKSISIQEVPQRILRWHCHARGGANTVYLHRLFTSLDLKKKMINIRKFQRESTVFKCHEHLWARPFLGN